MYNKTCTKQKMVNTTFLLKKIISANVQRSELAILQTYLIICIGLDCSTYNFNLKSSELTATRTPSSLKYNPVIVGSANVDMNAPNA